MNKGNAQHTILVVEDEADMLRILDYNLTAEGYQTATASNGARAAELAVDVQPDLIILDLRLPDTFGLDLLAQLKENPRTGSIPVIIVSALGDEETVVEGLNAGAEDYMTKPFRVRELMARVSRVLRRQHSDAAPAVLRLGTIRLDLPTHEVRVEGTVVELTKSEFSILEHFLTHPGRVFTRQQLCFQALRAGGMVQERTIDAHIRTIRRKLGPAGTHLATVWGVGYKAVLPPE